MIFYVNYFTVVGRYIVSFLKRCGYIRVQEKCSDEMSLMGKDGTGIKGLKNEINRYIFGF